MIKASVCTIGDEILIGQIVDTNSAMIARALGAAGIRVTKMLSFGDEGDTIVASIAEELRTNDIVITTGGLGPTKDDVTKAALAKLSGSAGMVESKEQTEVIRRILSSRGRLDRLDLNRAQAYVPDKGEVIVNQVGTAPIMVFRLGAEMYGHPVTLYAMPGVPFETEDALPEVIDDIRRHQRLEAVVHGNIMTYGIAESALAKKIEGWEDSLPSDMRLAYLPDPKSGVKLRLSVYGGDRDDDAARISAKFDELKGLLGENIYSFREDTLEHVLGEILSAAGKTVSAAESCTGGEISHLITSVPGSSAYYLGSVTSYAIPVKEKVLGVPHETIEKHGVVSAEVAAAMAEGVRKLTGSDFSVATTGFAGPGGGDERYPEGTVWVGVSSALGTETARFEYHNDRERNIERFAASALFLLTNKIKKELNA